MKPSLQPSLTTFRPSSWALLVAALCLTASALASGGARATLDPLPGLRTAQVPTGPTTGAAQPPTSPAAPAPPTLGAMPLQPGDVIGVTVEGEPELTGQYTVREDGKVIFPTLGATAVVGYTPTQLADHLSKLLLPYVKQPVVAVTVLSGTPRIVSILGEAGKPGVYDLRQCPTVLALLAVAGNATPDGDLSQAVLIRKGETLRLIPDNAPSLKIPRDIPLEAGDAVVIPARDVQGVNVMGAVKAPRALALTEAATAGKAIIMAGGPTAEGDAAAAYVMRGGKQLPIDLTAFTQATPAAGEVKDLPLEVGDVLMVPTRSDAMVYVVGEVKTIGAIPHSRSPLASTAVSLAGGLTESANGKESYLLRRGQKMPVDLTAVLREGRAESDLALQPGDVLVVPKQLRVFYLVGQVAKPGPQSLDVADTVLAAWGLAGGALPEGDVRNVIFLRNGEAKRLDMEAMADKGDMQGNLKLEPGDQIIVPRLLDQVYVLGQVARPGAQPLRQGDTLIDVLGRAGGPTALAQVEAIALVRKAQPAETSTTGAPAAPSATPAGVPTPAQKLQQSIDKGLSVKLLDLARVQAGEDVYLARAGDVIYVPAIREKRGIDWLNMLVSVATGLILGR